MLDPIILSIPLFFLLIVVELICDARQSKKSGRRYYRSNDFIANLGCGAIDQLSNLFAILITVGIYSAVFEATAGARSWTVGENWFNYILVFVAVDFLYYWSHRWSHKVNLFWTGHVVHHQSEEYNLSVALRQGALQKVWMFWVYLPLALLGFPAEWIVLAKALNLIYQFWIHTEAIKTMGWFEKIFNTPSHHRVHHGRNPKYIDKNHAGVFIVWDRLFGTFQQEEETPTYGITKPLQTFDPVLAHVTPFRQLAFEVGRMPTFGDKLRYLFKAPGWYPAALGGFQPAPEIEQTPSKFDRPLSAAFAVYYVTQQLLLLGLLTFFLLQAPAFSIVEQVAAIGLGFAQLSLIGAGVSLGGKKSLEHLRLFLLLLTSGFVIGISGWVGGLMAVLALASYAVFQWLHNRKSGLG